MTSPPIRAIGMVLLGTVGLTLATPPDAEQPDHEDEEAPVYGRAPDTVIPYRHFQEPYNRFFQSVMEFRGAGRDETPVDLPETVRIGFMGPAGSAPDADLGRQMLQGVQVALEQANADGGYQGIPLELIVREDSGSWGATSNEMTAFRYEDDVLAVIGSIDGGNTHIALRVALKTQMAIVNTGATDPTLTETNIPWLIRCMADDRQQGYALAHHMFHEGGIEKVVALRVNDRYGRTGIGEFRDAARRLGHPLGVELRWERGDRDFSAQLDRVAQTEAEAIVLWGNAADAAAVVREIRRRELPLRIFGCDRLVSRPFLKEAAQASEGVVAVATYDPGRRDPRLGAFAAAFRARFNQAPGAFAAHAYDGANILIAAIREAGLNRARIRDRLYERTRYDGITGPIEFDATLNDVGPVYIATVRNGAFVYCQARFTDAERAADDRAPYRTLAQSAPLARSPERSPAGERAAYVLGCFLPLDAAGQSAVRGAQMALADANAQHLRQQPIELLVRDARGAWGQNSGGLVDLVFAENVLAVICSTDRRATHLTEMLAAKFHFPVVTLCGDDPTITRIPLPWVFCVAPAGTPEISPSFARRYEERYGIPADGYAALGYDAATLVADGIRAGTRSRLRLREGLADTGWRRGVSGTFRFDALGNRIDRPTGDGQTGFPPTGARAQD